MELDMKVNNEATFFLNQLRRESVIDYPLVFLMTNPRGFDMIKTALTFLFFNLNNKKI